MPTLQPTNLRHWRILARRWRKEHPGSDPLATAVGVRRGELKARAAYYVAALDQLAVDPTDLTGIACEVCGTPTASWCEGCYERCGREGRYSAVCTSCDQLQLVCPSCETAHISYADGHLVYRSEHLNQQADGEATAFSVTAWVGAEGQLFQEETDVQISFEDLARVTGRDVEELIREFRAEGGHGGP